MVVVLLLLGFSCYVAAAGSPVWNWMKRNSVISLQTFTNLCLQVCVVCGLRHSSWSYIIIMVCCLKITILLTPLVLWLVSDIFVFTEAFFVVWVYFNESFIVGTTNGTGERMWVWSVNGMSDRKSEVKIWFFWDVMFCSCASNSQCFEGS
jgi:uncharacterized membrane protein